MGFKNCKKASDEYKHKKEQDIDEATLKTYKNEKNKFNRKKAMYVLKYSSYIIDVSLL